MLGSDVEWENIWEGRNKLCEPKIDTKWLTASAPMTEHLQFPSFRCYKEH